MSKTVVAVFSSRGRAEQAVSSLREAGFNKEISIAAKGEDHKGGRGNTDYFGATMAADAGDGLSDGVAAGGLLGGLAGLAVGAGALVVPGIGPLIAAGPIAGMLSGAATGGIAGGLVDWGIPEAEGRQYEEDVKQGRILVSVQASDNKADEAASILKSQGADRVKTH
ncbi:DUF1269 domain-containing protein [Zhaonella formicivorans]|uniref:DUF1269 domain-containing protein n=1 Tax=Zhaonella formicivorans TaxID=2528593 RepID=UPI0010E4829C|nr:hypothetical protein [Zhaonella formicivorans]